MSYTSDDDCQLSSAPPSVPPLAIDTVSITDPGDSNSVFLPTLAARAAVPVRLERPQRTTQKRTHIQAQLSVPGVVFRLF